MVYNIYNQKITSTTMPTFWALVESGQWEKFTFESIIENVSDKDIFLDIGSWNGVFSVFAEKLGASCYAIEPDHVAYKETMLLFKNNNSKSVAYNVAISDKVGVAELNNMGNSFGNSESSLIDRGNKNVLSNCKTDTLSGVVSKINAIPTFIKMDVEGAEVIILKEAKAFFMEHSPTIHISFHPAWIPNFEKELDSFAYLFDIYDVISDAHEICTKDNFLELIDKHQHAFLLKRKK